MSRFWIVTLGLYVILAGVIWFGLSQARRTAMVQVGNPASQEAWEQWREAAAGKDDRGPVERSVPHSPEPPTLVLLRDHFWVCVAGALTITSALFWTLVLFVRGALMGPAFPVDMHRPETAGDGNNGRSGSP